MSLPPESARAQLQTRLAPWLDEPTVEALVSGMDEARQCEGVWSLLEELFEVSAKVGRSAVDALPELRARAGLGEVTTWLDLAVAMAAHSGATTLKYLKESPWFVGMIEGHEQRERLLGQALELAEHDANVAMEFLRSAPELGRLIAPEALPAWVEIGLELTARDYVLGPEFFRDCPKIAQVIPVEEARGWVEFGLRLVTTNQFGKTDYYATLDFFRSSPSLLQTITDPGVRRLVIQLGAAMAGTQPQAAVEWLAEAPAILGRIDDVSWQRRMLQYGQLVVERDVSVARDYLRRCPELVRWQGYDDAARRVFEEWFKNGMEILAYSPEGARAYFALETKGAVAAVQEAQSGVPLRQVARSLKLFVQALCGRDVAVQELPDDAQAPKRPARVHVSEDGRTLAFPSVIRQHAQRDRNAQLYHVMAAHEAGHLEFGTYDLRLDLLADLVEAVRVRYGHEAVSPIRSLADFCALYPQPGVIRDLWTILEDARVERHLRRHYPGLSADLEAVTRDAVTTRSLSQGLSVRELLLDGLLVRSAEIPSVEMPEAIRGPLDQVWAACAPALAPSASAEEAIRTADAVYQLFDQLVGTYQAPPDAQQGTPEVLAQEISAGSGAADVIETEYRPLENWNFRGAMAPHFIGTGAADSSPGSSRSAQPEADLGSDHQDEAGQRSSDEARQRTEGASSPAGAEASPRGEADDPSGGADTRRARWEREEERSTTFHYDEWDGMLRDYRTRWCRVVEDRHAAHNAEVAEHILAEHGPAVRLMRRYFESIRPPALRLVRGVTDGEEIDLDAVVGRRADLVAGAEPSERVYLRRERRERDVAVAFLVDLSGSTSRRVGDRGKRVIDIEKAGLILLAEALDAIGDQYAIYGFSGKGRRQVDLTVLKEFGATGRAEAAARIGALEPRAQNRDGAAIRHATRKLKETGARVKLLVLLSDGKPLDDGYAEDYALEDTKMALREAVAQGVDPFCITVDREAASYVRRMYGDVRYVVIDQVEGLPERLPRVYHHLTS